MCFLIALSILQQLTVPFLSLIALSLSSTLSACSIIIDHQPASLLSSDFALSGTLSAASSASSVQPQYYSLISFLSVLLIIILLLLLQPLSSALSASCLSCLHCFYMLLHATSQVLLSVLRLQLSSKFPRRCFVAQLLTLLRSSFFPFSRSYSSQPLSSAQLMSSSASVHHSHHSNSSLPAATTLSVLMVLQISSSFQLCRFLCFCHCVSSPPQSLVSSLIIFPFSAAAYSPVLRLSFWLFTAQLLNCHSVHAAASDLHSQFVCAWKCDCRVWL